MFSLIVLLKYTVFLGILSKLCVRFPQKIFLSNGQHRFLTEDDEHKIFLTPDQREYLDENHKIRCPNCVKIYKNMNTFRRHFRYECGKEPQFICRYCSRAYTQKNNLKHHHFKCHPFLEF